MAAPTRIVEERELQKRLAHVDTLVGELQQLPDPATRAMVEELLSTVLDLHGEALSRMLDALGPRGDPAADRLLERMANDDLIKGVLLLHGLHPMDMRTRVEGALESVRPYMRSHGGGVELIGVAGDVVRIRLEGHCQGCPSSMVTLKLAVEKAIYEAAPDVSAIEVVDPEEAKSGGPVQISGLMALPMAAAPRPAERPVALPVASPTGDWVTLAARATHIDNGSVLKTRADGDSVLIARAGDVFYAYVARCPACEGTMEDASLDGAVLVCAACGGRYDIRRAGAGIGSDFRIEPLPLLEDSGVLRIAIPARLA
jgi:Fe-S cluster biogenesis protein NfuA/nitrite reductase/ring-hydroxylating ferredoxin subunit